jgi:hypothetical protein
VQSTRARVAVRRLHTSRPFSDRYLEMPLQKEKVSEVLECLGFRNCGSSKPRAGAVYHYSPLVDLYKYEIPSLFGRLLRDEGLFFERTDPDLFEAELCELLEKYGPLIWPVPGQGPRDHLLTPQADTLYHAELVYPRDDLR